MKGWIHAISIFPSGGITILTNFFVSSLSGLALSAVSFNLASSFASNRRKSVPGIVQNDGRYLTVWYAFEGWSWGSLAAKSPGLAWVLLRRRTNWTRVLLKEESIVFVIESQLGRRRYFRRSPHLHALGYLLGETPVRHVRSSAIGILVLLGFLVNVERINDARRRPHCQRQPVSSPFPDVSELWGNSLWNRIDR